VAVTAMFLWPHLYYSHYGAFDGPFLALAVALPVGRLTVAANAPAAASGAVRRQWIGRHTLMCLPIHDPAAPPRTHAAGDSPVGLSARHPAAPSGTADRAQETAAAPAVRHPAAPPRTHAARRARETAAAPAALPAAAAAVLGIVLLAAGILQFRAESRLYGTQVAAAADRLIPAGACVVTNDSAYTVAADRFISRVPGCPAMTDSFGTLIAMTSGQERDAPVAGLRQVIALWQATLDQAGYVWITSNTVAQIPWNRQLYDYLTAHFRLIGFGGTPTGYRYVPRPGLYARR
jgi:hypothetical protein